MLCCNKLKFDCILRDKGEYMPKIENVKINEYLNMVIFVLDKRNSKN